MLYRCLIVLAAPLIFAYTLYRANKDGGKRYLSERLGIYLKPPVAQQLQAPRWVHAASVGEVMTVLPLLRALDEPVLVTTTTPTGAAVLAQQNLSHVRHCYFPIDLPGACTRFLTQFNIRSGWLVETEIWPWLYACAHQQHVALTIVSGRLSDKTSAHAHGLMAQTFKQALTGVSVFARSEPDAMRFRALGAEDDRVHVVGNLKYANAASGHTQATAEPLLPQRYVLCASTHEDEECQLAKAWIHSGANSNAQLVIVPRHPERGASIARQLAELNITAQLRSLDEQINGACDVYIADKLGELQLWYQHAVACFIGGSLIERGGHNMLEAARCYCPTAVGPFTFNFSDIMGELTAQNAIVVTQDANEVVAFFNQALEDGNTFKAMAVRAKTQASMSEGVLDAYVKRLM